MVYHKPVCLMMKLDCCLSDFRLFTQGSGSRKQNILSSDYTHSWWIIHFGCALFNMCDPIPIFDALVVSQWGHESGLSRRLFLQLKIGQLSRGLHPRRTLVLDWCRLQNVRLIFQWRGQISHYFIVSGVIGPFFFFFGNSQTSIADHVTGCSTWSTFTSDQ